MVDHIAIPPDDAEGSDGRYLDPLATLAFLAGATSRIGLGTAVLILPYRPPLPTAKWIATIQELSGGRLRLGVGVGWMHAEFRAAGVDRARRGAITDETLAFLNAASRAATTTSSSRTASRSCSARSRRARRSSSAARRRTRSRAPCASATAGCRWAWTPEKLREPIAELKRARREAGKPAPEVVAMGRLAIDDASRAAEQVAALAEVGVTRFVHAEKYADRDGFARDRGAARASLVR